MTVIAQPPTEAVLPIIGRSVPVHWEVHATLMTLTWCLLVPLAVLAIRYFKPAPTENGIPGGTGRWDRKLAWWTVHWMVLYGAIGLSLASGAMALVVSRGFSGSLHAVCGIATLVLGALQIVSAWCRGTHGSMHAAKADPRDPSTWRGDHYDMTPRRVWFEAYHKTAGYFALLLAATSVVTGLATTWFTGAALVALLAMIGCLALAILLEGLGWRHDTYRSVYGDGPQHPGNRRRGKR